MISVVLATYNEEKNIEQCLSSVKSFADEIIVVDGSSKDKTRQIAKDMGAKVIKTTNKKNFHINKQMAMDEAKGNLVLQLDADEAVDDDLIEFIKKIEKDLNSKKALQEVAWWVKRKNLFCGRWLKKGGQYPDPVIRLYINGKARLPQKDVHEQMEVDGKIGTADGHLWHYSNPKFSDYLRKFNTYTSFKAQQLLDANLKINPITFMKHMLLKPVYTFLMIYIRHKGFVDGWQGFIFALFSGLHHPIAYIKFWELKVTS
jgi:glycosyltransferase involved in cell wall biosynthesis